MANIAATERAIKSRIARRRAEEESRHASSSPSDEDAGNPANIAASGPSNPIERYARAAEKIAWVSLRELFLPVLGNWTGVEQQAASAWGPAITARAMIVFKLDVGDQVVVQDYRRVRADHKEFSGHGVFMIDRTDGAPPTLRTPILWWFFDSEGDPPQPARGSWHQDELILEKITPWGVAEHRFAVAGGQLSYRIRIGLGEAAELEDFLSGSYRRISGH